MITASLVAILTFAFVSSITPGPNNIMLMASGVNFGFRRTLPHMLGVCLGFTFMMIILGVGLIQIFEIWPITHSILKVISVIYMIWLAWKIANSTAPNSEQNKPHPLTFFQAALFQWVNPKAWSMGLTAVAVYASEHDLKSVLILSTIFGGVNIFAISAWVWMGTSLKHWLNNLTYLRIFNWVMATLLLASLLILT